MEYRRLGDSGLVISVLGFGTTVIRGEGIDVDALTAGVHAALDAGITLFDTADTYAGGAAEEFLGRALVGQRREEVVLSTKVYFPTGPGPNDRGLSRKHIREAVDASLRRLGTDHIDLYHAHRYDHDTPLAETMLAFADVVRAGKALYIGVSEWTADQIAEAARYAASLGVPLVCDQAQYSALWRAAESEVVPMCRRHGLGVIAWAPLAGGILTGKYQAGQAPAANTRAAGPARGNTATMRALYRDEVLDRVADLAPVASRNGLSPAQLALAWVLRRDMVTAALVSASDTGQLEQSVRATEAHLDDDTAEAVDRALAPVALRDPALVRSPPHRP